jgi:coenzyme F420-reducing hydrogenase delta subunit
MVARDDDRPTLVARVDPGRCVSCGICAGSCAPMGVGPPGRTGRDQLVDLRERVLPGLAEADNVPVVAVCCARAPAPHHAALRARGAHVHVVSCVGNLHSSVIERFLRAGAPGVIVCGCPPRDCASREGPKWLHERVFNDREAELQPRVDRQRVRLATIAAGDLRGTLAAFDAFARDVALLERPLRESDGDLDVECEPVPFAEVAT